MNCLSFKGTSSMQRKLHKDDMKEKSEAKFMLESRFMIPAIKDIVLLSTCTCVYLQSCFSFYVEFLSKMAPDVQISEILNLKRPVEEEEVTVIPEELFSSRSIVLKKEIQNAAKRYFTEDAWLVAEKTLDVLKSKKSIITYCKRF
jgi:hypothetical protein